MTTFELHALVVIWDRGNDEVAAGTVGNAHFFFQQIFDVAMHWNPELERMNHKAERVMN